MATEDVMLISFGPLSNCTLELCDLEWSAFGYLPNIPANATFLAVFGLLLVLHLVQGVRYKEWAFMSCVIAGCCLEIAGYVGRIMLHANPFDFNAFLVNLVPITVAPVFFCAAIYVQLTRVINHTDPSKSRLNPRLITYIFIPCDITSLVLQGAGGALSAGAMSEEGTVVGVNVSKAGLIFQVVTLVFFIALSIDYLLALKRSHKKSGAKLERALKILMACLSVATILILVRCVFRIYELKNGYFSPAFRDEETFIAFESVFMCVAVACLNGGHPGRIFHTRVVSIDNTAVLETTQVPK
ncbi:parasitic phase-specific protein PSP-1 [Boeremia exigua]|uniref:parasitic phase-specific protein PSP-1 n=1 Tax=Boeremia exigua TaxID=749465 RepID=UPI001E8E84E2|nr:parasitic phase-specific protein PSP-1 [Boeremia exigua]KAH6638426.1 parasitic phase-specific protein PSP-1 [Boeremia exigua]